MFWQNCRTYGKIEKFIHVSTDEVYGDSKLEDKIPKNEQSILCPNNPYSATKACSDHLCNAWLHTFNLPIIRTNCSNNYGPYQFPEKLIPTIIIKALNQSSIPIYGSLVITERAL